MKQVPTQFIENCKKIGVDKSTAVAYYSNKVNKKPITPLLESLVPKKFTTVTEATRKLSDIYKTFVDSIKTSATVTSCTEIKSEDYLSDARKFLETTLGKFKEPKYTQKNNSNKNNDK